MPHPRLQVAAAYHALGIADSALLLRAADEAIDDGVYSHSLGRLIMQGYPILSECSPLFGTALRELQLPSPDPAEAVIILLEHHVLRLMEGAAGVGEALEAIYSLHLRLGFGAPDGLARVHLEPLRPFVDRYYELDEYHVMRSLDVSAGTDDAGEQGLTRFHVDTLNLAEVWCRERWAPRVCGSWITPNVRDLARGIVAGRAFHRLPHLADALQDEGYDDAFIISHLMYSRPHVRTCFVLGLLGDPSVSDRL